MNRKSLNQIFTAYIDKFRFLNDDPQCEGYKWYSVVQFKEAFDLDAPNFAAMLKKAKQVTYNIIDSYNQPFGGLVKIAEQSAEDAEAVRELFRALLKDDGGDLTVRQEKITVFLKGCDALVEKYYPGSFLYKNDQRSAMAYLFFNDPDNHYLYKATEANYLSDCVGFYDDWGAMSAFKLDIYHRFCDELITEIKATPELLKTNESRYENTTKKLHADPNLHILLFDIIYCSYTYNLYSGLSFDKVTTAERKLYQENKVKAQEMLAAVQRAEGDLVQLQEAQRYFNGLIASNAPVSHKAFGELEVVAAKGEYLSVRVKKNGETKNFVLLNAIANGFLKIVADDFEEKVAQYKAVMLRERDISSNLSSANRAFEPYKKYLDLDS